MMQAEQKIPLLTDPLETIIEGCRQNNLQCQEQLYRQCYPQLISICFRYAGDMDGAGIIFNNAMLRVFQHISRYRHHNKWLPWIRTIVIHCSLDYAKQRLRFREEKISPIHEESFAIAEDIFQRVSVKEIQKLIQQIPKATATVFNLFVYDGYTHKQVADALGISEGTSKWHVNEGRKFLKAKLESLIKE